MHWKVHLTSGQTISFTEAERYVIENDLVNFYDKNKLVVATFDWTSVLAIYPASAVLDPEQLLFTEDESEEEGDEEGDEDEEEGEEEDDED